MTTHTCRGAAVIAFGGESRGILRTSLLVTGLISSTSRALGLATHTFSCPSVMPQGFPPTWTTSETRDRTASMRQIPDVVEEPSPVAGAQTVCPDPARLQVPYEVPTLTLCTIELWVGSISTSCAGPRIFTHTAPCVAVTPPLGPGRRRSSARRRGDGPDSLERGPTLRPWPRPSCARRRCPSRPSPAN